MTSTVPSTDHDDRVRSPADLLRFVIATCCLLLLLLAEWLFGEMLVGFGSEFLAGHLPGFTDNRVEARVQATLGVGWWGSFSEDD